MSEKEKKFSKKNFEYIMSRSNTTWPELCELFGPNFKNLIYMGKVSEGTLYDACLYMNADYRYVLSIRDNYKLSDDDPVKDPRISEPHQKNIIVKAGESSDTASPVQKENTGVPNSEQDKKTSEQRAKTSNVGKTNKKKAAEKSKKNMLYREDNHLLTDRVINMQQRSGLPFTVFSMLLGVKYPTMTEFLSLQTFQEGTTSSIAWILGTTPDYLTGKSEDPYYGADRTIRYILDSQTFLLDSGVIWEYRDKIQKNLFLNDRLTEWLVTGDRLVTEEMAERIARITGLHRSRIKSHGKHYKSEPSIKHILDGKKENKEETDKKDRQASKDVKPKQQPDSSAKITPMPAAKNTDPEHQPSDKITENEKRANEDSSIFSVIDSMSDDDLDVLIEYVDMLKKMRSFRAKLV